MNLRDLYAKMETEELLKIISLNKEQYTSEAITAATAELRKRGESNKTVASRVKNQANFYYRSSTKSKRDKKRTEQLSGSQPRASAFSSLVNIWPFKRRSLSRSEEELLRACDFKRNGSTALNPLDDYFERIFRGRISRKHYFGGMGSILSISLILFSVMDIVRMHSGTIPMLFAYFVIIVPHIYSLHLRRFHDLGNSGWNVFYFLVPILNLYVWFVLLFKKGEVGPNKYGQQNNEQSFWESFFNTEKTDNSPEIYLDRLNGKDSIKPFLDVLLLDEEDEIDNRRLEASAVSPELLTKYASMETKELIRIITVDRNLYTTEAVHAAKFELGSRGVRIPTIPTTHSR